MSKNWREILDRGLKDYHSDLCDDCYDSCLPVIPYYDDWESWDRDHCHCWKCFGKYDRKNHIEEEKWPFRA